jgi:hypothetical protein
LDAMKTAHGGIGRSKAYAAADALVLGLRDEAGPSGLMRTSRAGATRGAYSITSRQNPTPAAAARSELHRLGQAGRRSPASSGDAPEEPGQGEAMSEQPRAWLANAGSGGGVPERTDSPFLVVPAVAALTSFQAPSGPFHGAA